MTLKIKIILIAILFLATFLRFWQIDKYPAGFNADEAAYGYNAYSLIQTGKDEFGTSWPVHLKSFADYKPGGTTYIVMPFVKVLGLNEFAVRLPSLLAGVFSVFLIFLLVQEMFGIYPLALLTALFLAIFPWHIHFSRGAWETNLATTFLLLGTYAFLKGLQKPKLFVLSIISYAASMYTYHTPRVVIPLLGLFLIASYRKAILNNLRMRLIAGVIGFIVMLPFIFSFFGPAVSARFSGVSVFSDVGPVWQINRGRGEHVNPNSLIAKTIHNKPFVYATRIGENWLSHFNGTFLFVIGDQIKRSNVPDMGEMYLFDFIFVMAGLYFLIKNRPKHYLVVFVWLLVAPVAASLTFQSPNALRAHNMIIPLVIISAYGFYNLILLLKKNLSRRIYLFCIAFTALIISWNVAYFIHQYFVHYPKAYPEAWEYGISDLVDYLKPIHNNYNKVYVTEKYDQPYIIFLFYLKYPPAQFQKEAVLTARDKFGFSTVRDFSNFHFENINWDNLKVQKDVLICGTDEEIPSNVNVIHTINFRNGQPAFQCALTYWPKS
ncbi:MAG: glycosyltransferase family 39 protein [bacterium]|nr:glycosyltransferase family 39 protein [bacterium]